MRLAPLAGLLLHCRLAGYIFGKNAGSEKMQMTTPVISRAASAEVAGSMSFVLPSRYWKAEAEGGVEPPAPVDDGIALARRGGGVLEQSDLLACMWFGGFAGATEVAKRKQMLNEAVSQDSEWESLPGTNEPLLLQYNDPFTYAPLR